MNVNVTTNVIGKGSKLYLITTTDVGSMSSQLCLGDNDVNVLKNFFDECGWNEEYVKETFLNIGWVFDENWSEDDDEGEGYEHINIEEIGVVFS